MSVRPTVWIALFCTMCIPCAALSDDKAAKAKREGDAAFELTGRLLREDGLPVKGAHCMVHQVKGTRYTIDIRGGIVKNPSMTTDEAGRFSVLVPTAFLPEDRKLTLTCTPPGQLQGRQIQDGRGIPAIFEIQPPFQKVDLEKLFGKITLK